VQVCYHYTRTGILRTIKCTESMIMYWQRCTLQEWQIMVFLLYSLALVGKEKKKLQKTLLIIIIIQPTQVSSYYNKYNYVDLIILWHITL
jgi:hypothetical protein